MMEMPWQGVAAIAAFTTLIAAALYGFGILPWWGALIMAPIGAVAFIMALMMVAFMFTDWSH